MEAIHQFVRCNPPTATAQQKGAFVCGGRVRFFTKSKVRQAENILAALFRPHLPPQPFDEPVEVEIEWRFPYRKSERRSIVKAAADVPHTSRPDLDNLEKNLLDVMTRLGYWTDDSLVCSKRTKKVWCKPETQGIRFSVAPIRKDGETREG